MGGTQGPAAGIRPARLPLPGLDEEGCTRSERSRTSLTLGPGPPPALPVAAGLKSSSNRSRAPCPPLPARRERPEFLQLERPGRGGAADTDRRNRYGVASHWLRMLFSRTRGVHPDPVPAFGCRIWWQ